MGRGHGPSKASPSDEAPCEPAGNTALLGGPWCREHRLKRRSRVDACCNPDQRGCLFSELPLSGSSQEKQCSDSEKHSTHVESALELDYLAVEFR